MIGVAFALMLMAATGFVVKRDLLHPAVAFPAVWGVTLTLIQVAQPMGYHPVGVTALLYYLVGALAFAAGGYAGSAIADRLQPSTTSTAINYRRLSWACIGLHVVFLPWWWTEVQAITDGASDILMVAFLLRAKSVTDEITVNGFVGNYLVIGFVLLPIYAIGLIEKRVSPLMVAVVAGPWIVTNLLTNGRSTLVQLVLVLAYIRVVRGRSLRVVDVLPLAALFAFVFGGGAVLVGKGGIEADSAAGEAAGLIVQNFFDYALQGPILFSVYLDDPQAITPTWDAFRVPCLVLQKVGLCDPGPLHQDYLDFGVGGDRVGNVYSIYFSTEPRYGVVGTLFILTIYGFWAAFHHSRARYSLVHAVLGSFLFSAVVLSIFLDSFFPLLNFIAKATLVCLLVPLVFGVRRPPPAPVSS